MAEESASAPPVDDPYDLGDTELYPAKEVEPYVKPERQRGPDGKFVKQTPGQQSRGVLPEEQESAKPPAPPKHPQALTDEALEMGFEASDIESMPTSALAHAVRRMHAQQREFSKQQNVQRVIQEGEVRPLPPDDAPIDLGGIENDYDPQLIGGIKKALGNLQQSQAKRIRDLEEQVQSMRASEDKRTNESNEMWVDRLFAQKGDESLFGKGRGRNLDKKSAHFGRRMAVINEAGRLAGQGADHADVIACIPEAMASLFGDISTKPASPSTPKPAVSEEQWDEGVMGRVSQRSGLPELKGDRLATVNLEKKMRELEANGDSEILDGLLG